MKNIKFNEHVMLYRYGKPIETTAIDKDKGIDNQVIDLIDSPNFDVVYNKETGDWRLKYSLQDHTQIIGLGQSVKAFNKRGSKVVSFCNDDPSHTPDKDGLYGAHNFLIVRGDETFGLFVDLSGEVIFDCGFSDRQVLDISLQSYGVDLYVIKGSGEKEITHEFLKLIGKSYAPPLWAFGYQQSRWSYDDAEEVNAVIDQYDAYDIPCDAIYLDIDYMERFKDFTIDEEKFPQFKSFVADVKEKGIHLVPIIDAGVKIEEGYKVYEEGKANNYFVKDKKGNDFVGAVWPGRCHFPDFLNKEASEWFGNQYQFLTDQGIDGFWNDMNEPAIFYSEKGLSKAIETAKSCEGQNVDIYKFFELKDSFSNLQNNMEDYKNMIHNYNGQSIEHDLVHNLYGYFMTKSASEALVRIDPLKRYLLFSRASYVGMHRYSGIWTGDNSSWWSHILMTTKMMPSIHMNGFLYSGPDTGGFGSHVDGEMLIRWHQLGLFMPLLRNHSALGTRRQEPYTFDEKITEHLKYLIKLRYRLITHIYSEFMKARNDYKTLITPLRFEFEDDRCLEVEDQFLFGEGIMVTPVYEPNVKGRYVYVPEEMMLLRIKETRITSSEIYKKGDYYVPFSLDEQLIWIRKNHGIILNEAQNRTKDINKEALVLVGYISDTMNYYLYEDDGISLINPEASCMGIHCKRKGDTVEVKISNEEKSSVQNLRVMLILDDGSILERNIDIRS